MIKMYINTNMIPTDINVQTTRSINKVYSEYSEILIFNMRFMNLKSVITEPIDNFNIYQDYQVIGSVI